MPEYYIHYPSMPNDLGEGPYRDSGVALEHARALLPGSSEKFLAVIDEDRRIIEKLPNPHLEGKAKSTANGDPLPNASNKGKETKTYVNPMGSEEEESSQPGKPPIRVLNELPTTNPHDGDSGPFSGGRGEFTSRSGLGPGNLGGGEDQGDAYNESFTGTGAIAVPPAGGYEQKPKTRRKRRKNKEQPYTGESRRTDMRRRRQIQENVQDHTGVSGDFMDDMGMAQDLGQNQKQKNTGAQWEEQGESSSGSPDDGVQSSHGSMANELGQNSAMQYTGGSWEEDTESSAAEPNDGVTSKMGNMAGELGQNSSQKNKGGQWETQTGPPYGNMNENWSPNGIAGLMEGTDFNVQQLFNEYARQAEVISQVDFQQICNCYSEGMQVDGALFETLLENNNDWVFHEGVDDSGTYYVKEGFQRPFDQTRQLDEVVGTVARTLAVPVAQEIGSRLVADEGYDGMEDPGMERDDMEQVDEAGMFPPDDEMDDQAQYQGTMGMGGGYEQDAMGMQPGNEFPANNPPPMPGGQPPTYEGPGNDPMYSMGAMGQTGMPSPLDQQPYQGQMGTPAMPMGQEMGGGVEMGPEMGMGPGMEMDPNMGMDPNMDPNMGMEPGMGLPPEATGGEMDFNTCEQCGCAPCECHGMQQGQQGQMPGQMPGGYQEGRARGNALIEAQYHSPEIETGFGPEGYGQEDIGIGPEEIGAGMSTDIDAPMPDMGMGMGMDDPGYGDAFSAHQGYEGSQGPGAYGEHGSAFNSCPECGTAASGMEPACPGCGAPMGGEGEMPMAYDEPLGYEDLGGGEDLVGEMDYPGGEEMHGQGEEERAGEQMPSNPLPDLYGGGGGGEEEEMVPGGGEEEMMPDGYDGYGIGEGQYVTPNQGGQRGHNPSTMTRNQYGGGIREGDTSYQVLPHGRGEPTRHGEQENIVYRAADMVIKTLRKMGLDPGAMTSDEIADIQDEVWGTPDERGGAVRTPEHVDARDVAEHIVRRFAIRETHEIGMRGEEHASANKDGHYTTDDTSDNGLARQNNRDQSTKPLANDVHDQLTYESSDGDGKDGITTEIGGKGDNLDPDQDNEGGSWEKLQGGAGTMKENVMRLNRYAKNAITEFGRRLPRNGSYAMKFVVVCEGVKARRCQQLAEALTNVEELMQAYGSSTPALQVHYLTPRGVMVKKQLIRFNENAVKGRGPVVAEGKVIFRYSEVANDFADQVVSEGKQCRIYGHNWGAAVAGRFNYNVAARAFENIPAVSEGLPYSGPPDPPKRTKHSSSARKEREEQRPEGEVAVTGKRPERPKKRIKHQKTQAEKDTRAAEKKKEHKAHMRKKAFETRGGNPFG